jgi:uncharacterized damage-inducible protein DinB
MNTISSQIAKALREVQFGGNWTDVNLKDTLQGVTWQQATTKIQSFNTIAVLVFHINYYIDRVLPVLKGEKLDAKDSDAFSHPPVTNEEEWQQLLDNSWKKAEEFAALIENLPDEKLLETFVNEKYGNYYRNLTGIIEHAHYHLGQIVLLKKMM